MKIVNVFAAATLAAALSLSPGALVAQSSTQGTSPDNMGSTGWTGPHKGEKTGDGKRTEGQPLMATGRDLKGPPKRFSPSETPE